MMQRCDAALFGTPYDRFNRLLSREVRGCATVLDVGCGTNSPLKRLRPSLEYMVGVDAHIQSILASRSAAFHHAYCAMNILDLSSIIRPSSFDCVAAMDVIEHLTKEQGLQLLRSMEQAARKRVIVFTPNGFLPQSATPDNPYQLHVSGWTVEEMHSLGYRVFGVSGWRPLRGEYAEPHPPKWLTERLSLLSEPWLESRPRRAFQLLCVKQL